EFTHGQDIYSGAGKSPTDLRLTAHELTHVVQQTVGGTTQRKLARGEPDIFLRQGEYNSSRRAGQALLAHELMHVVQQDGEQLQRARTQAKEGAATGVASAGREKRPLNFLSTPNVLNPESILNLQRQVGNTVVTTLIELASASARGPDATVQRAPLPAADDPHGYTQPQGVQNVAKTGLTPLGVHGLKFGVSGGCQKEYGKRTSAEKQMTDESPDHMAVVIMPDKLDPDRPVQVVLHFHGWGFRQEKGVKDPYAGYLVASGRTASKKGDVRDVDLEHWEQQMSAVVAARSAEQPQIVAILVQGRGKSEFGNVPTYGYVQEVFGRVSALSGIKSYSIVLSAHSGGGSTKLAPMIAAGQAQ